jgi:hypothetical protein
MHIGCILLRPMSQHPFVQTTMGAFTLVRSLNRPPFHPVKHRAMCGGNRVPKSFDTPW